MIRSQQASRLAESEPTSSQTQSLHLELGSSGYVLSRFGAKEDVEGFTSHDNSPGSTITLGVEPIGSFSCLFGS